MKDFYAYFYKKSFAWDDEKNEIKEWYDEAPDLSNIEDDKIKYAISLLREERNLKLSETDWWASSDLTMTSDQKSYRKKLRDLPANSSPKLDENARLTNVTWPTKPE
jgi:hypothetical protein